MIADVLQAVVRQWHGMDCANISKRNLCLIRSTATDLSGTDPAPPICRALPYGCIGNRASLHCFLLCIYAFVTLNANESRSEGLKKELKEWTRKELGSIASPDVIQWAPNLPKTRSGKIMRRILHKIAQGEYASLGDVSTLADPQVVADIAERQKHQAAILG